MTYYIFFAKLVKGGSKMPCLFINSICDLFFLLLEQKQGEIKTTLYFVVEGMLASDVVSY